MISFAKIAREFLMERMTFKQILSVSEPARIDRGKHDVRSRSIGVTSEDGQETWNFNYKSNPSTTGERHHGYIKFFKDISNTDNVENLDCIVDCDCEDFKYKWTYNNNKYGISPIGNKSYNGNNGQKPQPYNDLGVGLCKHLVSLGKFLKTSIEAPTSDDEIPEPEIKKVVKSKRITPETPKTINAPTPEDSYSDTRSDSSNKLNETVNNVSNKMNIFIKSHPQFNVEV